MNGLRQFARVSELLDASISSPASGDFLRYNGSAWANTALAAGDIPSLDAGKITTGTFAAARIQEVIALADLTDVSGTTGTGSTVVLSTSPTFVSPVLGTPSSGTLTNCTALPVSGITASTSTALGVGSLELGHASDTTLSRVSAGVIAVEGVTVDTISAANTLSNKTLTTPTIASFTNATHNHSNAAGGGTITHANLTSLSADDHTQYGLLAGRSGGQTYTGGTGTTDTLTLKTTSGVGVNGADLVVQTGNNGAFESLRIPTLGAAVLSRDFSGSTIATPQSVLQLGLKNGTQNANSGPSVLLFGYDSGGNKEFIGRFSALWENSTDGAEAGAMALLVRANTSDTTATTEVLRCTSAGRVGIGFTTSSSITARLHLPAGTATASTGPFKFTSGTNLTTAEAGTVEYNGTNLFFTRAGTTRENVVCSSAVNSVSPTSPNRTITVNLDGTTYYIACKTTND